MEFPYFFNKQALLNELQIYAAFFSETNGWEFNTKTKYQNTILTNRTWAYKWFENSFLSGKPVFIYSDCEAILYDYSNLAKTEITNSNLENFADCYGVISHDLLKENLSVSTIKEILANNAKAAIQAEKIEKQIEKLKALQEDF